MLRCVDDKLRAAAERAKGFMPTDEGLALYEAASIGATRGPLLEVGSYCGKSTIYLAAAALDTGSFVFTLDHHRGSEEHQPGEGYHDPKLFDETLERVDTLPSLLRTIEESGIETMVAPIVAASSEVAARWSLPLGFVFLDGGHSDEAARADYEGWAPHVTSGGLLAIHDVFEDPAEGGRPPYDIYLRALRSGAFEERSRTGSLRVLERVGDGF